MDAVADAGDEDEDNDKVEDKDTKAEAGSKGDAADANGRAPGDTEGGLMADGLPICPGSAAFNQRGSSSNGPNIRLTTCESSAMDRRAHGREKGAAGADSATADWRGDGRAATTSVRRKTSANVLGGGGEARRIGGTCESGGSSVGNGAADDGGAEAAAGVAFDAGGWAEKPMDEPNIENLSF